MTHSIDTSFRQKKQARAALRRRTLWRRLLAGLAVVVLLSIAAGFYLTADYWSFGDEDEELHAVEGMDDVPADASVYVPAIIDLAGDPMWITLAPDAGAATKGRVIPRPAELDQAGVSPQIEILSDVMLSASEKFMTTIPSTQEDFAFFQAQRQTAAAPSSDLQNDLQPSPDPQAKALDLLRTRRRTPTIPKPAGVKQSMQARQPFPHSRRPRSKTTRALQSSRMNISGSRRPKTRS